MKKTIWIVFILTALLLPAFKQTLSAQGKEQNEIDLKNTIHFNITNPIIKVIIFQSTTVSTS